MANQVTNDLRVADTDHYQRYHEAQDDQVPDESQRREIAAQPVKRTASLKAFDDVPGPAHQWRRNEEKGVDPDTRDPTVHLTVVQTPL